MFGAVPHGFTLMLGAVPHGFTLMFGVVPHGVYLDVWSGFTLIFRAVPHGFTFMLPNVSSPSFFSSGVFTFGSRNRLSTKGAAHG
jgi:hypothetical protein